MSTSRPLTHDEKKAAEAAFMGRPFDASWSGSARKVYDGILRARGDEAEPAVESVVPGEPLDPPAWPEEAREITCRRDAIEAGILVDVTHNARSLGLNLTVGISKSLWDRSIGEPVEPDPGACDLHVRDMLLAVRLKLAGLDVPRPWLEVPVLFPAAHGDASPRLFPIYALFHHDPVDAACLTLIHPEELSALRPSARPPESDREPPFPETP